MWLTKVEAYIKKVVKPLINKENNKKNSNKNMINNAVIAIIIGIIIIILGGSIFPKNNTKEKDYLNTKTQPVGKRMDSGEKTVKQIEEKDETEQKMEEILSCIQGTGKVDVMITYVCGKEIVHAYEIKRNESDTEEKDNGGGMRSIKQNSNESKIDFEDLQGGGKKPIIVKELTPQVKGVVVVSDGGADARVRENICSAVQILMDIPIYKVQVFEREKK